MQRLYEGEHYVSSLEALSCTDEAPSAMECMRLRVMCRGFFITHINRKEKNAKEKTTISSRHRI